MKHQNGRCASNGEALVITTGDSIPSSVPSGKRVLVINGSVSGTINWTLSGQQMSIVGINGGTLSGNSSTATLHVTGGDLYVRGLAITGGAPGVWASGGAILRLDHADVSNNPAGGILLDGAGFDIKNTTVNNNAANTGGFPFGGMRIQNSLSAPKSMVFSTITGNQILGVTCDGSTALSPSPTSVLVTAPLGALDVTACGFITCGSASANCGAQP